MITKLHHIAITLESLKNKGILYKEFAEIIGLKPKTFSDRVWGIAGMSPDLLIYKSPDEMKGYNHQFGSPGFHHIDFHVAHREVVDQVYYWTQEWKSRGVTILDSPKEDPNIHDNYYEFYFTDLDGLRIGVVSSSDINKVGIHKIALTLGNLNNDGNFYDSLSQILELQMNKSSDKFWSIEGVHPKILLYPAHDKLLNLPYRYYAPGFHHLAFQVENRDMVDQVFNFVKSLNSKDAIILDEPQEYPDYADGYYAVYFTDYCGIKLEVAHIPSPTH